MFQKLIITKIIYFSLQVYERSAKDLFIAEENYQGESSPA